MNISPLFDIIHLKQVVTFMFHATMEIYKGKLTITDLVFGLIGDIYESEYKFQELEYDVLRLNILDSLNH